MALIREEFTKLGIDISSIALNKTLAQLLREANFEYKRIEDYHTQNTVKIIQREQPNLVYTNSISISPFMIAFTSGAAYLKIPCLQIYNGNIASPTTHGLISLQGKAAIFFKRVIEFCSSLNNFLSFIYLLKTTEATSNYVDSHNKLFRELLKLKNPYVESHRYREGASLIVSSQQTKDIMIGFGWPEESVFVLEQSRLDLILRQMLNRD